MWEPTVKREVSFGYSTYRQRELVKKIQECEALEHRSMADYVDFFKVIMRVFRPVGGLVWSQTKMCIDIALNGEKASAEEGLIEFCLKKEKPK